MTTSFVEVDDDEDEEDDDGRVVEMEVADGLAELFDVGVPVEDKGDVVDVGVLVEVVVVVVCGVVVDELDDEDEDGEFALNVGEDDNDDRGGEEGPACGDDDDDDEAEDEVGLDWGRTDAGRISWFTNLCIWAIV